MRVIFVQDQADAARSERLAGELQLIFFKHYFRGLDDYGNLVALLEG